MEEELSVQEELKLLRELQKLDLQLQDLRNRLDQVPHQVSELDQALDENRGVLSGAQAIVEEQQREQRQTESEVGSLREQLSKYKTQLMGVKTNKEYQAMIHEIEAIQQQIETKEDQILELMMAAEDRLAEARTLEKEFQARDKELRQSRTEAEAFSAQAVKEIDSLDQERERLVGAVPPVRLRQYERIFGARGGRAISPIIDGSCQVCFVVLRKQLIAEVKTSVRIATCEACNRILYYDADSPAV